MAGIFSIPYFKLLLAVFGIVFVLREYFSFRRTLVLKYIFTPLITMSVILFVLLSIKMRGLESYSFLILLGLMLSLVGDTILMIEELSKFFNGLLFFLMAHISYICAFSLNYSFQPWNAGIGLVLLLIIAAGFGRFRGKLHKYKIPVLMYMLMISLMLFLAFGSLNGGVNPRSLLTVVGAVTFTLSDIVLAVNAFIFPIPKSTVITWALYAPAQLLIAMTCFFV